MDATVYEMIGLMSGTSLDGLDIAHVRFHFSDASSPRFELLHSKTIPYSEDLIQQLTHVDQLSISAMMMLDKSLGLFYAKEINAFLKENSISKEQIDAIASHGQTILHQPANGFTLQIGCGTTLAFHTGIKVVNDFRTKDVVAGGQGAPLVPIGDFDLFADQADAFLNIGGFTNVSFKKEGKIIAFDVTPGNLPLNKLAASRGLPYDKDGELARSGDINFFLLDLLNTLPYYTQDAPKSLGTEWLEEHFFPMIKFDKEIENNLRTLTEHIGNQVGNALNSTEARTVFVTGGGAKNAFLLERIRSYFNGELIVPDTTLIDYKEALIFAYLGALYLQGKPNTLCSVTGAQRNTSGGVLHLP
ncbi:MAG: anhydro-N-acetylmuramic acid kinase [Flavobacteriia bacterium]|jgi:anhydro-N-acetylmuramic acid kinase